MTSLRSLFIFGAVVTLGYYSQNIRYEKSPATNTSQLVMFWRTSLHSVQGVAELPRLVVLTVSPRTEKPLCNCVTAKVCSFVAMSTKLHWLEVLTAVKF